MVFYTKRKKSALEIRYNKGEILSDDEIKELIHEIYEPLEHPHPLRHLYYGGYREYINERDWICHFCGEKIERHKGYWGLKTMRWSERAKLCHRCFLKFLTMMEENDYLMSLFGMIRGKELEILSQLSSQDRQ